MHMNDYARRRGASLAVLAAMVLAATTAAAATVVVSPVGVSLPIKGTRMFTAAVSGLSSSAVTWEVSGKPGGSAQTGTISATGAYVAPASIPTAPMQVTITARAVADPKVSGSVIATVRHQVPWLTQVTPAALGAGKPFSIDVAGSRFVPGAVVFVENVALATTFVSDTLLRASGTLGADKLGNIRLRVENPGPVTSVDFPLLGVPSATAAGIDPDALAAVRFLEQATFGPAPSDVVEVQTIGIDAWLATQMDPVLTPPSTMPDGLDVYQVTSEWFRQMGNGPDQLRQRMMFALSQLFVVSAMKNTNGEELSPWVRLLSRNAFGNFRTLLEDVTLSPTMGKYLDMVNSRRPTSGFPAGANENYARELLQLFTIGLYRLEQNGDPMFDAGGNLIPTYDQDVVRNVALAFTGWVYPTKPGATRRRNNPAYFAGPMEPWEADHDRTKKTIFDGIAVPANTGAEAELALVLDHIFHHPNVAPFVATRLIRSLVTSNPSLEYIERVADVFDDNGQGVRGDLAAVLVAILTDDEARRDTPTDVQGHLKDPMLHTLGFLRALGGQVVDASQVLYLFTGMGQRILAPTTVFGFYSPLAGVPKRPDLYGPEFQIYTPALAIARANFLYSVVSGQAKTALTFDISPFVAAATSPANLANFVDAKLFYGRMSPELRQAILTDCTAVTDPKARAIGALYISAISSEYAVLR